MSHAVALRLTVPETPEPLDGAVRLTVGGVVSPLFTVTLTDELAEFPAASTAVAVIV